MYRNTVQIPVTNGQTLARATFKFRIFFNFKNTFLKSQK